MQIKCPNCGTEFEPVKKGDESKYAKCNTDLNGIGYLIPKEIHNDNIPRNINGRFVKKETTTEYGTENINTNKESKVMNNEMNFDMDKLAQMVAERMKSEMKEVAKDVAKETKITSGNVDGGQWAKTSKFYGKELCGFMYNPYLVRRFIPAQFMSMMNEFKGNVNKSIQCRYNYIDAMEFLREECNTLSMLQKRDPIAFEERLQFWNVDDIKHIFIKYFNDVKDYVRQRVQHSRGKNFDVSRLGTVKVTTSEVVIKHKAVYQYSFDEKEVFKRIDMLISDLMKCISYKQISDTMAGFKFIKIPSNITRNWEYNYAIRKGSYVYKKNYNGFALPHRFVENFKKAGAYYTLKSLIMFDDVTFEGYKGRDAIVHLRYLLNMIPNNEAYKFYAKLKDVIKNNNINVEKYSW